MLKKKILVSIITISMAASLTACGGSKSDNAAVSKEVSSTQAAEGSDVKTDTAETKKVEEEKPVEIPKEWIATEEYEKEYEYKSTVYVEGKNGEKTYLRLDAPEVEGLYNTIESYEFACYERNYNNITGTEEYEYYSKAFLEKLKSENDAEETVKFFKNNKLDIQFIGMPIIGDEYTKFNEAMTKVQVRYGKLLKYKEAAPEYLKTSKFNTKNRFEFTVEATLIKEDGKWKIDSYNDDIRIKEIDLSAGLD